MITLLIGKCYLFIILVLVFRALNYKNNESLSQDVGAIDWDVLYRLIQLEKDALKSNNRYIQLEKNALKSNNRYYVHKAREERSQV